MSRDESCNECSINWPDIRAVVLVYRASQFGKKLRLYLNTIQSHLQYGKDSVQLVFSEGDVSRDLSQHMDGLQPHLLDFIIKHVHQEVKTFFSKAW